MAKAVERVVSQVGPNHTVHIKAALRGHDIEVREVRLTDSETIFIGVPSSSGNYLAVGIPHGESILFRLEVRSATANSANTLFVNNGSSD